MTSTTINYKKIQLTFIALLIILLSALPSFAEAHAYSASYTKINFTDKNTEIIFSIDTLSIIELMEDADENQNGVLEKSELKAERPHIEELVTEFLGVDKGTEEQTAEVSKIKIERKDTKEFLTFTLNFPAFSSGETFTFIDGFYVNDADTNYINLLSVSNRGEKSEAVLEGDNRNWTMLLTDVQQEQGQVEQPVQEQENKQLKNPEADKAPSSWLSFFKLGMFHILTGYDHLLFLLALLLRKQTFKQYAAIITSFTLAHSITLSLSVLGWINLPSVLVEAVIAFSICYVAAENLFRKEVRGRWILTFLFGLIHGLGFASILKEMAISKSHLAVGLVNFNLGIEFIQLLLVLLVLPLLAYIFKLKNSEKITKGISVVIIVLGAVWLVERLFF